MTRRFALGLGAGLTVLCVSLASLERVAPVASPEADARPGRDASMSHAKPAESGRAGAQAATRRQARTRASTHARAHASTHDSGSDWDEAREADMSSRAGDRAAPVPQAIELHPAASAGGAIRFVGFDPDAPRALWLWRLRDERAAVVARTRSEPDGTFAFSPLLVPAAGLSVVATPARAKPGAPGASRVRQLAARTPRAPRGVARDGAHGDWHVRVTPAEAAGAVLVGTADEQVIGRFALPELPGAPPRALDLSVVPDVGDDSLWLAHELPDGRRSAWRQVHWIGFEDWVEFEKPGGDEQ